MAVSKTDFVRALQCEKMLWLDAHAPEYKIIPPEVQARLDAGNDFGDKAMGIFGEFVETTTFRADGRLDYNAMIQKTQLLVATETPVICEGAFSWYGNYCAVDILRKTERGYELYEVKNAPAPREEFIVDLAFQRHILYKCGVRVTGCFLVLNDTEGAGQVCVEQDGTRYRIEDVTRQVRDLYRVVDSNIFRFAKLKGKAMPMPDIEVGCQCDKPYRCWYYDYCHKSENPAGDSATK